MKEKTKYILKRVVGFVIAPFCIMFQLGRAFERINIVFSGKWERVYR